MTHHVHAMCARTMCENATDIRLTTCGGAAGWTGSSVSELIALAVFSFVSAVTPGPNNVLLSASGVQFGLRPTLRHVLGTSMGIGTMAMVTAAGLGALIAGVPQIELSLKVVGSIYLVYLAFRVAGSRVVGTATTTSPLRFWQAVAFQYVNPKAWVFVVAALTAFRPTGFAPFVGDGLMATTMMVVVLPAAFIWAAAGSALRRLFVQPHTARVISVILAGLVMATVWFIWA